MGLACRAWFLVTIGAKDGSTRQGWVCEQDHPLVRMCGPWDWPGFELIDNSSIMPLDMLKRYIHVTEQYLADESKTEFEASAATVNAGPLITNLEKAIDTDHDGKVTALELKHAQEMPWMAEALSHLVVRCESEWGGGLGKWEALSPLMKKLLWLWKTEIERIGKLQWWEQVASVEGFPKEPSPWHFHPIGIAGNFIKSGGGPLDKLIKKLGDVISHGEGGYDAYNTGTHGQSGPVVHAYTDPPAGTITRQKIKDILASGSKSPDATDRYFTSGKYQTTVYTLAEAVKKMGLTGEEIYDADMQERVFREFLIYHAGGGKLAAFIFKNVGSLTDAQYAASQEWASIAAPEGTKIKDGRISDGTLSYYEKAKQNHANPRSTAMVIAVLEEIDRSR